MVTPLTGHRDPGFDTLRHAANQRKTLDLKATNRKSLAGVGTFVRYIRIFESFLPQDFSLSIQDTQAKDIER